MSLPRWVVLGWAIIWIALYGFVYISGNQHVEVAQVALIIGINSMLIVMSFNLDWIKKQARKSKLFRVVLLAPFVWGGTTLIQVNLLGVSTLVAMAVAALIAVAVSILAWKLYSIPAR